MKKKISEYERFMALSDAEKDAEVAQYDRGIDWSETKPLTREMREQERRAKRKRGRPRIGQGTKKVLVNVELTLLNQADAYARKEHVSRSQLFSRGLLAVLPKPR
jgi:hypothetical protein